MARSLHQHTQQRCPRSERLWSSKCTCADPAAPWLSYAIQQLNDLATRSDSPQPSLTQPTCSTVSALQPNSTSAHSICSCKWRLQTMELRST
jgi:hypothetical protein